jgi:hypothetical protein
LENFDEKKKKREKFDFVFFFTRTKEMEEKGVEQKEEVILHLIKRYHQEVCFFSLYLSLSFSVLTFFFFSIFDFQL